MFFPVSGIEISPFVPMGVAFAIAFVCSIGGLSGGVLLLPFQMSFLGFTSPAVSPTNHVYNIISTPAGIWRFIREERMVWPLTCVVVLGIIPGTMAGTLIRVVFLPDPGIFKSYAALLLGGITLLLLLDLRTQRAKSIQPQVQHKAQQDPDNNFTIRMVEFSLRRIVYTFQGELWSASTLRVAALCFGVGILGGAYGIGGGAIIGPFLVSVAGLPVHTVSGTTLFGNFMASATGLCFFQILAPFFPELSVTPDWGLGLLFGLGGLLGVYCGARIQRFVPAARIKALLLMIMAGTACRYLWEWFSLA
jgi:uncharacterized membrane protein YfcA